MLLNNPIFIIVTIVSIFNLLLGLLVFIADKGWRKLVNKRFFIFTSTTSLWMLTCLFSFLDVNNVIYWTKVSFGIGIFSVYLLMRFILVFPQNSLKDKFYIKIIDIFTFLLSVFGLLLSFTDLLVKDVVRSGQVITVDYGIFYSDYLIALISIMVFIFFLLFQNYRNSTAEAKSQIKTMVIGVALTLLFIVFADVIYPLIFGNDFLSNFDVLGVIFLASLTAYAIVKYQAFNIKVILTQAAVVIVLLAIFVETALSFGRQDFMLNIIIFVISFYSGYLIIKSVQDEIRKKEQLQELSDQLEQANTHLKDLDKMKTEFVSLASHELLTPTSAIEGYLSMMLDEHLVKLEDPKAVQYMDRVYRSAKRLARLIADMLNISRIEEGRLLVEKKDVDLTELTKQTIEELKFKAEEHKQKMEFADPGMSLMTFADPDKVKEILVNIIGNAIKYTLQPGTIHISIEKVPTPTLTEAWGKIESVIKASTVDDQESIHAVADVHMKQIVGESQYLIKVKDEGVGIPKEELTKLFKKFHRVGNFSTQESQGTGLGLYITRALVELHHGRVWPDSEGMGHGSTFTFSLPVIESKQAIVDLEAQSPQTKEQLKPLAKPMGNDESL